MKPSALKSIKPPFPVIVRFILAGPPRGMDFGPTFAAEKLTEHHGCSISHETLRGWMIADGLWVDRRHRLALPHQPRRRRDCHASCLQFL